MNERGGSFVAVRRISQGEESSPYNNSRPSSGGGILSSGTWIPRGLSCVCTQGETSNRFDLTTSQVECLRKLQRRISVVYDSSITEHQEALRSLWRAAFPERDLSGLVSEQWKEMGWQGRDPSTDFRGGGFVSLENLLFLATNFPKCFRDLLEKRIGERSTWEYPFAVAGVNITFMLVQMLHLRSEKPPSYLTSLFLKMLAVNDKAFDILYCITFKVMDTQWLRMGASYMDFNIVVKSIRHQLEIELVREKTCCIYNLPSYSLLTQ